MRIEPSRSRLILTAFSLAALLWVTDVASASAHARLLAATPPNGSALITLPPTLTLTLSEPIALGSARASIQSSSASASLSLGDPLVLDGTTVTIPVSGDLLEPQTVTVAWRVVSATDGHETTGLLIVSVATGLPPSIAAAQEDRDQPWGSIALAAMALLGLALQVGAIIAAQIGGGRARRAMAVVGVTMTVVGLAGDVASRELLGTPPGRWLMSAAALSVGTLLLTAPPRWAILAILPWLGSVCALVAAGHAAGEARPIIATAVGTAHAAFGLAWAGTLVALAAASGRDDLETALRRLGPLAVGGVVGLGIAGVALTAMRVDGLTSLSEVAYGQLVVAKIVLLALAIAVAAINRLVVAPRRSEPGWPRLTRPLLTAEAIVLAAALAIAGALSTEPPADAPRPVSVASRAIPVSLSAQAGDLTLRVDAAILGAVDDLLHLAVVGPEGQPVVDVGRLIVATTVERAGDTRAMPVDRVDAAPALDRPGTFTLPASILAVQGRWTLDVTVRRAGIPDVAGRVAIDTTGWSFAPPRLVRDAWRWPHIPLGSPVLVVVALIVLVVGLLGVRRSGAIEPLPALIVMGAIVAIAAGFTIQAIQQVTPTTAGTDLIAPPADPLLIAAAGDRYRTYCLACHAAGGAGRDDSDPLHAHGAGTNLIDAASRDRTDGDLAWLIAAGVPGTTMPAYDSALTAEERWALVAYLRDLQAQGLDDARRSMEDVAPR